MIQVISFQITSGADQDLGWTLNNWAISPEECPLPISAQEF